MAQRELAQHFAGDPAARGHTGHDVFSSLRLVFGDAENQAFPHLRASLDHRFDQFRGDLSAGNVDLIAAPPA